MGTKGTCSTKSGECEQELIAKMVQQMTSEFDETFAQIKENMAVVAMKLAHATKIAAEQYSRGSPATTAKVTTMATAKAAATALAIVTATAIAPTT